MNSAAYEWLAKAQEDLLAVEKLSGDEALTNVAAFHAQQCVEKCLQAVFEAADKKVPRTHDLVRLNGLVQQGCHFEWDEDILHELSTVYLESRYPSDFGMLPQGAPLIEDVWRYHAVAKSIFTDVARYLGKNG